MRPNKWKMRQSPDPDREYLVLLSYLPLKTFRAFPRFFKYTAQITKQLDQSPGLIGYSLQAQIFNRTFLTLSVWEDESALMDFVNHLPHSEVMQKLAAMMGPTRFTRWNVHGAEIPPGWPEAKERMLQS